jgi:hypothetical protein
MQTTTLESSTQTPIKPAIGEFGHGRYSATMAELFRDSQRLLGFSEAQAHVTASRLGIDLGRLSSGKVDVTLGKSVSKDGQRTLKETCSVKAPNSWAMSIGYICVALDALRKQGLEPVENTVNNSLMEFVNDAAKKLISE